MNEQSQEPWFVVCGDEKTRFPSFISALVHADKRIIASHELVKLVDPEQRVINLSKNQSSFADIRDSDPDAILNARRARSEAQ